VQRYQQHCPIARTAELLGEPWTLLVLRELSRGRASVADIASGVPGMTQPLLVTRLKTLEKAGVVRRLPRDKVGSRYQLTPAGRELRPALELLGRWGQRWLPAPRYADIDTRVLMREICAETDPQRLPVRPVVVAVEIADGEPKMWWLTLSARGAVASESDPGLSIAVQLRCTIGALTRVWLGHCTWLQAVQERSIVITGEREAARSVVGWIGTSHYATVQRVTPALERTAT
jgi:DNA-binding HxlR family transcriptional regulator